MFGWERARRRKLEKAMAAEDRAAEHARSSPVSRRARFVVETGLQLVPMATVSAGQAAQTVGAVQGTIAEGAVEQPPAYALASKQAGGI